MKVANCIRRPVRAPWTVVFTGDIQDHRRDHMTFWTGRRCYCDPVPGGVEWLCRIQPEDPTSVTAGLVSS